MQTSNPVMCKVGGSGEDFGEEKEEPRLIHHIIACFLRCKDKHYSIGETA